MLLAGCLRLVAAPTPQPMLVPHAPLRTLAERRALLVGTAVDPGKLDDPAYANLLADEFSLVTPENVMKFEVVHPEPGRYDFQAADDLAAFAAAHHMQVRGHTLVWDSQLPDWILEGDYTREQWRAILREHIYTVVGHYRGRILAWDVVNEAVNDDGGLVDSFWRRKVGREFIALAFQWAHEADPEALLFYNDNGGEGLNAKSQAIYALAQGLLQAGMPLDGVGLQMHTALGNEPNPDDLLANLQRLAELGLQIHITEMDVRLQYSTKPQAQKLRAQAEVYRDVMAACLQVENCTAFVTWGLSDRYSWIPGFTGQPDQPLLFDRQGWPKPAYWAVHEALAGQ
jgi:endo-1,4-beta-xylanase